MKPIALIKIGIKALSIIVCLFVLLVSVQQSMAQTISNNQTGTQDGWYWSFWKDNGNASMTLYPGGRYTTTWNGVNNFIAGKGWAVGSQTREICFSGTFNGGNNGYLALYGWTKNDFIEYYVVENYGIWIPPGGTSKGTFFSDGGTYNIYETTRTNYISINGPATFRQYWSVRSPKRSSGKVTFANHVAAWKEKGMNLSTTMDFQIFGTEGYLSIGSSDITISDCGTVTEIQEKIKNSETLKVFPNPFTSSISVDMNGMFEYMLLSSSGELLLKGTSENKIELGSDLAQGIYFLKIKQADASKVVKICKN